MLGFSWKGKPATIFFLRRLSGAPSSHQGRLKQSGQEDDKACGTSSKMFACLVNPSLIVGGSREKG